MRKYIYRLSILSALAVCLFASKSFADDYGYDVPRTSPGLKDECLILAKNCPTDSIQERIERITNEINRGTDVYSPEELKTLERQLYEFKRELDNAGRNTNEIEG
jgi:hypothetical protein